MKINDLAKALEDWKTSKRLFLEADGNLQDGETERLAFVDMLPADISSMLMHMELPAYDTFDKI